MSSEVYISFGHDFVHVISGLHLHRQTFLIVFSKCTVEIPQLVWGVWSWTQPHLTNNYTSQHMFLHLYSGDICTVVIDSSVCILC